jgi:hypothetical protein
VTRPNGLASGMVASLMAAFKKIARCQPTPAWFQAIAQRKAPALIPGLSRAVEGWLEDAEVGWLLLAAPRQACQAGK